MTPRFASITLPLITTVLAALVSAQGNSSPSLVFRRRISDAARRSAAVETSVALPPAEYSLPIIGSTPRSNVKKALLDALISAYPSPAGGRKGFTSPVAGSGGDAEYLVNVTIGGQDFSLIIDTGSSDTWVAKQGFSCFDLSGNPASTSTCAFGTDGFSTNKSTTFKPLPNTNFNITYGSGEFLLGSVGFDTVQIGKLKVANQEIGLVEKAAWEGDGVNTGLMGLAWPNLTSVYEGTDPNQDKRPENQLPYNPVFFTAVQEKLVSHPYFSVALNRGSFEAENSSHYDPNLGYISFGGIAPVPVTNTAVTVPVQGYNGSPHTPSNATNPDYFFYTVDVQAYTFPGSEGIASDNNNTILDTGTTLNYLPTEVADRYNGAFQPPAVWNDTIGVYLTICNATVPPFSVMIGGAKFDIDTADQLLPMGIKNDQGEDLCASGTNGGQALGNSSIFILGDTFLHNIVATFNIETHQITITQRKPYKSSRRGLGQFSSK